MIDIIIPVLNNSAMTWRCLQHLFMFGVPKQRITLVDDGSTDSTPHLGAWLERQGVLDHRYVRHPRNLGCHAAWNTGYRESERGGNALVAFINNDVAVMPGCLEAMVREAKRDPRAIVGAAQMLGQWDPALILSHARGAIDLLDSRKDGAFFGGCFVVQRELLVALNGFDEQFYLTYGDTDFIERARDAGSSPCMIRGAIAFHGGSVTRRREFGRDRDISFDLEDRARFEKKWAARDDVLDRHPRTPRDDMEAARDKFWGMSENIE